MKKRWMVFASLAVAAMCSAAEHTSFGVEPEDVASVKIAFSRNYPPLLEIHLHRAKAKELTAFTTTNQFKTVAILIQSERISEPRVMEPVANGVLEVRVPDPETALRLAMTLMKEEETPPNKASDATSEPAPGAASLSHQR